jgi:glutathione peroxidase
MKKKTTYSRLKKVLVIFLVFVLAFVAYVEIVNRNSKQMTYRQKVLKAVYPLWMWFSRSTGKHKDKHSGNQLPPVSFYSLKAKLINGDTLDFAKLEGRKVLIVNTASECGYTGQYRELQHLYENSDLAIIGFPANDFKGQEPGSNQEIAAFCKANYGVTFHLAEKSGVLKGNEQNPVFRWLTDPGQNGWNSQQPSWNFSKYLVNENGALTHYFGPSVSPGGKEMRKALSSKK